MRYSVIFIVDKADSQFHDFLEMIHGTFQEKGESFEILIVAIGVERFVREQLGTIIIHFEQIKIIAFNNAVFQSSCLRVALDECKGAEILVAGAFQELTSESYRRLIEAMDDQVDVVVPYRKFRKDPLFNRVHSLMLNKMLGDAVGVKFHDIGCEVRLFRRQVFEHMEIYGNMYKYLPLLAVQKGFKIREIECEQISRVRRTRYYSYRLYLSRLTEILNLFFSAKYSRKPMRFFSFSGSILIGIGILSMLHIAVQKILYDISIGSRPLLILALVALVTGAQIASFGLLGEIIAFIHGRFRKEYTIEKKI
jgi:hypothetical protein